MKKILQYIFAFAFSGLLVWLSVKNIDANGWQQMKEAVNNANFLLILPVLVMAVLSHWFRAMRWRLLLEPINIYAGKFNSFAAVMIGYFVNMGVPRLGEVLKCTALAKYEKAPADKILGTIVIERAFDVVCFFLFLCITLLLEFNNISDFISEKIKDLFYTNGSFNYTKIAIIGATIIAIIVIIKLIFTKYKNNKLVAKSKAVLNNIKSGLKTIYTLKRKKAFIVYTLLIWAMYLLQIYAAFFAFKATTGLGLSVACVALTASTFAMIATPNGLGSFPIFVSAALVSFGIKTEMGITFGWIMWAVMTVITIILGVVCFILLPRLNKNYEQSTPTL